MSGATEQTAWSPDVVANSSVIAEENVFEQEITLVRRRFIHVKRAARAEAHFRNSYSYGPSSMVSAEHEASFPYNPKAKEAGPPSPQPYQ